MEETIGLRGGGAPASLFLRNLRQDDLFHLLINILLKMPGQYCPVQGV